MEDLIHPIKEIYRVLKYAKPCERILRYFKIILSTIEEILGLMDSSGDSELWQKSAIQCKIYRLYALQFDKKLVKRTIDVSEEINEMFRIINTIELT